MGNDYESVRKKYRDQVLKEIGISVLIYLACLFIFKEISQESIEKTIANIFLGLPWLAVLFIIIHLIDDFTKNKGLLDELKDCYYKECILPALQTYLNDISLSFNEGIYRDIIDDVSLDKWNGYRSNYLIKAKYKGIDYTQADVTLENHSGDDSYNIFFGQWSIVDNNKPHEGRVFIRARNYLINTVPRRAKSQNYSKVDFANREFNEKYMVYAQNPDDALDIITPDVMQKLNYLYSDICVHYKNNISIIITKEKIHVSINSGKQLIKTPVFKKPNIEEETNTCRNRIKNLIDLIDIFI